MEASRDHRAQSRRQTADPRGQHAQERMLSEEADGKPAVVHAGRLVPVPLRGGGGVLASVVVGLGVPRGGGILHQPQVALEGDPAQKQVGAPPTGCAVGEGGRIHEKADDQPQNQAEQVDPHPGPAHQGHRVKRRREEQPRQYVPGIGRRGRQKSQSQGGRPEQKRTGAQEKSGTPEYSPTGDLPQDTKPPIPCGSIRGRGAAAERGDGIGAQTVLHEKPPLKRRYFQPHCHGATAFFSIIHTSSRANCRNPSLRPKNYRNPFDFSRFG